MPTCNYYTLKNAIDVRCFKKCVSSRFASDRFEKSEETCVNNCVDRFFDAQKYVLNLYESNLEDEMLIYRLQHRS